MTQFNSKEEANKIMELCLGKILNIGSRTYKNGDIQVYENMRALFMEAAEFLEIQQNNNHVSFVKDYYKIHHD